MYESNEALQNEDLNSLEHYGIKGQKWGLRRFQNPDGSYTELGKERRRVGFEKESKKDDESKKDSTKTDETPDIKIGGKAYKDMTKKELRAAKKRARHNEAERRAQREFNRDKRDAIDRGDMAFISKNISKFTNDEIDAAVNRYKKMQNVFDIDKANKKDADHYMDKAIHYLSKMNTMSKSITDIYNNFTNSSKAAAQKRQEQYKADQEYYKSLQEEYKSAHPNAGNTDKKDKDKDKGGDNSNKNKGSQENVDKEKQKLQDLKKKNREEDLKNDPIWKEEHERLLEKEERRQEKLERQREKEREKRERQEERERERKEREAERERERREEEEYERREAEKERQREYEKEMRRKEREAEQLAKRAERERIENNKKVNESMSDLYDDDFTWLPFGSKEKKSLIGSFFSKKDKDKYKDYTQSDQYKKLERELNDVNSKYLKNLTSAYQNQKVGSSVQENKMKKQIASGRIYDRDILGRDKLKKWENDLIGKYRKERGMDKETAKKYADRYIDYFLDMYDQEKGSF